MNINDTGIFRTSDTRYKHLDGKSFTIVSLLPESEFDKDEVGQMYIVDVDGNRINVYEDELIEAVKTVYKVWMSIEKVVTDKNGAETFSMVRKNINPVSDL